MEVMKIQNSIRKFLRHGWVWMEAVRMIACLFSCEHATCAVPEAFRELFRGSEETVTSPQGWDPGALNLAQGFSMKFRTPLLHGDVTRLLINLSESEDGRWSDFSGKLPDATKAKLVDRHERPYRLAIQTRVAEELARGNTLLHVMIHTAEKGEELVIGVADDGLARSFADAWALKLTANGIDVRVSKIASGGLVAHLLDGFPSDRYALLRIAVPQSYFLEGKPLRWETLKKLLLSSLPQVVSEMEAAQ